MCVLRLEKDEANKMEAKRPFSKAFANGGITCVQDGGAFIIGWPNTPLELFVGHFFDDQSTSWYKKRYLRTDAGQKTLSPAFATKGLYALLDDATLRHIELSDSHEESVFTLPLSIDSMSRKSNLISDLSLSQEELIVFYPSR